MLAHQVLTYLLDSLIKVFRTEKFYSLSSIVIITLIDLRLLLLLLTQ